jgi:hypothetical protein
MHLSSSSAAGVRFLGSIKERHGLKPSAREAGIIQSQLLALLFITSGGLDPRTRLATSPLGARSREHAAYDHSCLTGQFGRKRMKASRWSSGQSERGIQ